MRTLHLIRGSCSARADQPSFALFADTIACARAIDNEPHGTHRVVLVGDARAGRDAARAGLRVDRRVHPPLGLDALAWSLLRRERRWKADRVRVWSRPLRPLVGVVSRASNNEPPGVDHSSVGGGLAMPGAPHPGQPPGDLMGAKADRDALRALLGADPSDRVVALLADPPAHGDARRFAFVLGLLEVGLGPIVGLMSAGSAQLARGRTFHRLAVRRSPLLAVEGSTIPWLHAADAALLEGPGHAASHAAADRVIRLGIPLVAPDWLGGTHSTLTDRQVHLTDGRTRTLLPALLKALGAADPSGATADGRRT